MPTRDPQAALALDDAREIIEAASLCPPPRLDDPLPGRIGLEPERFAMVVEEDGRPGRRLSLEGCGGVLELLSRSCEPLLGPARFETHPPAMDLPGGGNLTFEPGAQLEHSTAVYTSASTALDDVLRIGGAMDRAVSPSGARLFSLGVDPWHTPDDVPQQLRAPRYHAMAAYLASRSPYGAEMMRNSCSLQVNLDLGPKDVRASRYAVANLLSPVLAACFSTSPERPGEERYHCRRARIWQQLDPTRSGFPKAFLEGRGTPTDQYVEAVLDADVLLFRTPGGADTGRAGFRFRDWLERGDDAHGRPTADDLRYHLTTVFFEVRARGFLEMRTIDALPPRWRAAAVAFTSGLVYDAEACERARALLEPWREDLHERWVRAGRVGLADAELHRASVELWRLALAGAERLGSDFLRAEHLADAADFADRYTGSGRAPADDLRDVLGDPARAVEWALGSGLDSAEILV
ncbi:MAG: glutamate-cysteine ligase family protein [Planctomycetota bacterium]